MTFLVASLIGEEVSFVFLWLKVACDCWLLWVVLHGLIFLWPLFCLFYKAQEAMPDLFARFFFNGFFGWIRRVFSGSFGTFMSYWFCWDKFCIL